MPTSSSAVTRRARRAGGRAARPGPRDDAALHQSGADALTTGLIARLYRFRWQVELYFKEWKSSANLHQYDAANPHIAAGLITRYVRA